MSALDEAAARLERDRPELVDAARLTRLGAGLRTLGHPWADEAAGIIAALVAALGEEGA